MVVYATEERPLTFNQYFYMFINIGSLTGQISMVYVEKYVVSTIRTFERWKL